jgi:hypothetical protein
MRRIARGAALIALLAGGGCRSILPPWERIATPRPDRPLDEPEVRTSRDVVSDKVMLGDRTRGGYSDSPAGP